MKIGIVGLGLIGGSIEKRINEKFAGQHEIFAVSKSQNRGNELKDLADADLIFLCGEQSIILKQLEEISILNSRSGKEGEIPYEKRAFGKAIITDVASTKEKISLKAQELGLKNFVPGHPMAGTEHKGYEASFADLFEQANWILCDSDNLEAKNTLEAFVKETLGAGKVVKMDAATHDKAVALISHLPLLLSLGLASILDTQALAKDVVGPGFKGMVRLAAGNPDLSKEIIDFNKTNISEIWENFKQEVDSIISIQKKDLLGEEISSIKEKIMVLN